MNTKGIEYSLEADGDDGDGDGDGEGDGDDDDVKEEEEEDGEEEEGSCGNRGGLMMRFGSLILHMMMMRMTEE